MKKTIRIIMSLLVSVCMLAVLLPAAVYATAPTVWITDSADKVWDNATIPTGAATSISLYAARNEYESAQICVYNPNGSALTVSSISCSSLASGGNTIPATGITVRREYVHANIQEHDISGGGDRDVKPAGASGWPDALVEPGDTIGTWNSQSISAGKTGVYWYQVYVPSGTATGTYTGTAVVNTNQGNVTVNVSVKVFSPTIPGVTDASSMNCYDWQHTSWGYTWATYGITDYSYDNPQVVQLLQNMAANMKKNRLNVVMVPLISLLGDTIVSDNGDYDNYTFNWAQLDAYLQIFFDAGCCKYIQICNTSGYPSFQAIWSENGVKTSGSVAWNSTVGQNYISQLYPSLYYHLYSIGLASKTFLYAVDEVNDDGGRDAYNWFAAQWRSTSAFGASGMVESAQYNETYYNQLNASTFCPTQIMYKDCAIYYQDQVMNYGKKLDMYYLNNPQGGYLNKYISMQLDRPRLFPLYVAHENGSGILFWAYDCFPGYNGGTQVGAFDNSHSGDETFTYPDTSRMSFYDSIRLESQLEGLEDAEIYKLLKATKPIEADKIYNSIITDPGDLTKFTRNGNNVNQAHRNMLEAYDSGKPDGYDYVADWRFDNNGNDGSGCGNTLTLYNSPTYSATNCVEGGYSVSLNGSNQYAGISSPVTRATDNITMSAWVNWGGTNASGNNQMIMYDGNDSGNGYGIALDYTGGVYRLCIVVGGVNTIYVSNNLTQGVWTHLALVRRDGSWELYINGVNILAAGYTYTPNIPSGYTDIGVSPAGGTCFFKGKVDDVRVCNRPLSAYEIKKLAQQYGSQKVMWTFNSDANDKSGNGLNMTLYGSPTYDTATKKEGTASITLNGTSQYARVSSVATSQVNNVTISAWIYWGGTTGSNQVIAYNGTMASNGFGIILNSSSSNRLAIRCGGTTMTATAYTPPTNTWVHVAAVRNAGTWYLYANGTSKTLSSSTTTPSAPTGYTTIGAANTGANYFKGKIDEVKIYERALSQTEISAQYTTPDTYKGMWTFNGSLDDIGGNGYAMTAYNGPIYNAADARDGTQCLYMRDFTNAMAARTSPVTTATDNLTMSEWVMWRGGGGDQILMYNGLTGSSGYGVYSCWSNPNGAGKLTILCGGVNYLYSNAALPTGVWTLVTIRRSGGTWTLFVNGTSYSVSNNTTTPNMPTSCTYACTLFNGFIDNMRVYETALTDDQIAKLAQQ